MIDSSPQGAANDTIWRTGITKRVRRVETVFFLMAVGFVAYASHMIDSTQRDYREAMSSLNEMQDAISSLNDVHKDISSLRSTQAALTTQIEEINGELSRRKLELAEKEEVVKPAPLSSYRKAPPVTRTPREFPISHLFSTRERSAMKVEAKPISDDLVTTRKMQTNEENGEPATSCNGTLFRVDIDLDTHAEETSFILMNMETGEMAVNHTFTSADSFKSVTFEQCIEKGHYLFSIKDAWGDGISCFDSFDGLPCYNIFIDNELAIPGRPFKSSGSDHEFNSNSLCLTENLVFYEMNFPMKQGAIHQVSLSGSEEALEFQLAPEQPGVKNSAIFFKCLPPGLYDVEFLFHKPVPSSPCPGRDSCYTVIVNDEIVIDGPVISGISALKHSFFITSDGIGREQKCRFNPLISPINDLSSFSFDDRVSRALNVIQALSNVQDIFTRGSPQYRATCYILYDDPLQIKAEDRLLAQRYALAVFLFSTFQQAEVVLPLDMCLNHNFECSLEGDISHVNMAEVATGGFIPTEIGHLEWLEELRLESNHLGGTIPTEIERLEILSALRLDMNDLTGTIPTVIGKLPLHELSVRGNKLKGTIPTEIGLISTLDTFFCHENSISGTIPFEMFNASKLSLLLVNANDISGSIPNEIGNLDLLQMFYANNNKLTGTIPPGLGNSSHLWMLDLSRNGLQGSIPDELATGQMFDEFLLKDNFLTGTIPNIVVNEVIYLENNTLTGEIPPSIFNLSIFGLSLNDNHLVGEVTESFCDNLSFVDGFDGVYDLAVDSSPWFLDTPLVTCPCCSDSICHMWRNDDVVIVGGTRKPSCPTSNVFQKDVFERFVFLDNVSNATHGEAFSIGVSGQINMCLSPTGCFTLMHEEVDGRNDQTLSFDREYKIGFSADSRRIEEQDTCDAVEVCGIPIGPDHPRRMGLNHLTHVIVSDLSILDDPSLPEYKAFCWIVTQDELFHEYDICDGTLMQRYIMVLFFYSFQESFGFETLDSSPTCDWVGVKCDASNKFVEHLDFSGVGLKGNFVTEIGLLTRLTKIVLSENSLTGTIDPVTFEYMPNLEVFDVSSNRFGGLFPKSMLLLPKIEEINLSDNILVGELPKDMKYSQSLKKFDVQNNLFTKFIPDSLIDCANLEVINLSKNILTGHISSNIGLLGGMKEIKLNENKLSGSLPLEMFNLVNIEVLEIQSNALTGQIPTEVGHLLNAKFIAMSHNFLKGLIPREFENLGKIEFLHLHDNWLFGEAPNMERLSTLFVELQDNERYIADCGDPSFALAEQLSCPTCSMCCNSLKFCQENMKQEISIEKSAFIAVFVVPSALAIFFFVGFNIARFFKSSNKKRILRKRDPQSLVDENSAYCLIFSKSYVAWCIYLAVLFTQGTFYYMFLLASSLESDASDWQYTRFCPFTSNNCDNDSDVNTFGWIMFFVATLFTLSLDYINSSLQILMSVEVSNTRMLISGSLHLGITVLALFCSFYYNMALATTNTELIVNAVILLFINDLDEQLLNTLTALVPGWVGLRIGEIREHITEIGEEVKREYGEKSRRRIEAKIAWPDDDGEFSSPRGSPQLEQNPSNGYDAAVQDIQESVGPAIEAIYVRTPGSRI